VVSSGCVVSSDYAVSSDYPVSSGCTVSSSCAGLASAGLISTYCIHVGPVLHLVSRSSEDEGMIDCLSTVVEFSYVFTN
jgi:hypothetical protein